MMKASTQCLTIKESKTRIQRPLTTYNNSNSTKTINTGAFSMNKTGRGVQKTAMCMQAGN